MKITINRDSVCMGDDAYDRTKQFVLPDDAEYEDLYNELRKQSYFPYIHGNNVVWVLSNKEHECIFSYFTYDNSFSAGLNETLLSNIDDGSHRFHLRYFSSPERWKEYISNKNDSDMKTLYLDGWGAEIKHCDDLAGKFMEYEAPKKSIKDYIRDYIKRVSGRSL